MEDLILSCKEHRLLQKFKTRLQNRYNVKIQMPDTATSSESDVIFISVIGEKHSRECVKKFLSARMKSSSERPESEADVVLITLSDSEEDERTTDSESKENSICVLEELNSARLLPKHVNMLSGCNPLDNSVCVIESPESIAESSELDRKKAKKRKKKRKAVVVKDALQSSEEAELCEVSSTTEEVEPKKVKLNEEVSCLNKEVADFIPLSKAKKKEAEKKNDVDIIHVEEECSAVRSLRPIVIDGSNVAIEHGKISHCFSAKGIKLAVEYFLNRGHTQVTAFVPKFRRFSNPHHSFTTKDPEILEELYKKQFVVFTPSRRLNGKCIASYDDRFIVQLASTNGGVIVSNDNYRDLVAESEDFKEAIENRLLMFCFVGDLFMVPSDPLGRSGPPLNEYLSFPPDGKT